MVYLTQGYGLRVASYGLRVTGYGLRVTGYGLRVASYGLRVYKMIKIPIPTPQHESRNHLLTTRNPQPATRNQYKKELQIPTMNYPISNESLH